MLKKLVKYGNSNALVLDKAILELLNIAEGSVLKISTDGKAITLTPEHVYESQKVSETYTSDNALRDISLKETAKRFEKPEEALEQLSQLYSKMKALYMELGANELYGKEVKKIAELYPDHSSVEFLEANTALRKKFAPELLKIQKELVEFENINSKNLKKGCKAKKIDQKQQNAMDQDFAKVFKTHSNNLKEYNNILNNSDYQHEAQLIAEKYKNNKNSKEYMLAVEELQDKYSPETKQMRKEIKAIGKKYSDISQK